MTEQENTTTVFGSGDVVEPGEYVDLETGAKIHVHERDELPEGRKIVQYTRRFRKVSDRNESVRHSAA